MLTTAIGHILLVTSAENKTDSKIVRTGRVLVNIDSPDQTQYHTADFDRSKFGLDNF